MGIRSFEIGSVSKVYTSLLLSEMVQRGEVALTDPVSKFLPPEAQITFEVDSAGVVTGLVVHQNGMNMSAKRIQ